MTRLTPRSLTAEVQVLTGMSRGYEVQFRERLTVGRERGCDLQLFDTTVSRRHVEIVRDEQGYTLRDLGSSSGSRVNGTPCQAKRLYHNDEISLGRTELRFICPMVRNSRDTSVGLADSQQVDLVVDQAQIDPRRTNIDTLLETDAPDPSDPNPHKLLKERTQLLRLTRLAQQLARLRSIDEIIQTLGDSLEEVLPYIQLIIFRHHADSGQIVPWFHRRLGLTAADPRTKRIRVNRQLIERCVEGALLTGAVPEGEALVVPMEATTVHGAIYLVQTADGEGGPRQLEVLAAIGSEAGRAIERCELEARIQHQNLQLRDLTAELESKIVALSQTEQDYRSLFENAHDAILIFRPADEVVLEVNPRACDTYGIEREAFVGRSMLEFTVEPELGRSKIEETLRAGATLQFETVQRRADGSPMWIEVNASRIEYGGVSAILSINRDITRRKQLEQQVHHAQKMEAMGRLAGGVAHDFNNMLTAIQGYAQLMRMRLPDESPLNSMVDEIWGACQRSGSLTRQLLAFSRSQISEPIALRLDEVVHGMEGILRRLIAEDISLTIRSVPDLGIVEIDPAQVEQVVMNLVVNAGDALPTGGSITIETANVTLDDDRAGLPPGDYTMLAVRDTGIGMDEATQARIFEPFYTTKPETHGTGLGLSTVYGIVAQHGGRIDVESAPGEGACFRILLPRVEAPPQSTPDARQDAQPLRAGAGRVLLVEDEPHVRRLAVRTLEDAGYTVTQAANGAEALDLAQRETLPFDALITDVVMPAIDGPELAARLTSQTPELPVVFMSGYIDDERIRQRVLGRPFLQKPFTPQALTQKVEEVLGAPRA